MWNNIRIQLVLLLVLLNSCTVPSIAIKSPLLRFKNSFKEINSTLFTEAKRVTNISHMPIKVIFNFKRLKGSGKQIKELTFGETKRITRATKTSRNLFTKEADKAHYLTKEYSNIYNFPIWEIKRVPLCFDSAFMLLQSEFGRKLLRSPRRTEKERLLSYPEALFLSLSLR